MPLVLSTKILTSTQKRHLFLSNISLVEYNAIKIKSLDLLLKDTYIENAIFSSQNAVNFVLSRNLQIKNAFCVGDKTSALLEKSNISIKVKTENARDLAKQILKKHPEYHFDFFCSKQRRNELPEILKTNGVSFQEHYIYETICNYKTFKNQFDAVLCFSPLGVKSFYSVNSIQPLAICIGETTGNEAKKYTTEIQISNKTSVESVILKAIKYFHNP